MPNVMVALPNTAFDSVSHPKLLHKLQAYGFSGELLHILSDFLCDRLQRVVLPNGFSTFRPVISGFPQGSVLGPVLFLIYINDIVDLFDNGAVCTKLYADDVKIYLEITNDSDCVTLQNGINKIYAWSNEWQLGFANDKCQHNHITLSTVAHLVDYSVSGMDLPTEANIRDLGLLVDSRLSFRDHINSIVSRGNVRAAQIWRCWFTAK